MPRFTAHIETLGCKLNQIESESIASQLITAGYTVHMKSINAKTAQEHQTLFSIVNTCTVTGKAEQKARRLIRLLLNASPDSAVIVTGCYAELERKQLEDISKNILVVPGSLKHFFTGLPQYLQKNNITIDSRPQEVLEVLKKWEPPRFLQIKQMQEQTQSDDRFALSTQSFKAHTRASIKIQDGCSFSCTYCRIRLARGKPVSIDSKRALEQIQLLEKEGFPEVVLTGVNLSLYRSPSDGKNFRELLQYLLDNTTSIALRISSLHPDCIDSQLSAVLAHTRIRPHFHLSIQSGSDTILHAMQRPYKAQAVLHAITMLRQAKANPFLACDIICGFPGETEEDFEHTLKLCEQGGFCGIHAFAYSSRPGTLAATFTNTIPATIANERVKKLAQIAAKNKQTYVDSLVGTELCAIIEKNRTTGARALSENFLHLSLDISLEKEKELAGKEVQVRIVKAHTCKGTAEEIEADAILL